MLWEGMVATMTGERILGLGSGFPRVEMSDV